MVRRALRWGLVVWLVAMVAAATVMAHDDGEQRWRGILESRPAQFVGTWVVGGRSFEATNATEFKTEDGPLTVGSCTRVEYLVQDGLNRAIAIESDNENECSEATGTRTTTATASDDETRTRTPEGTRTTTATRDGTRTTTATRDGTRTTSATADDDETTTATARVTRTTTATPSGSRTPTATRDREDETRTTTPRVTRTTTATPDGTRTTTATPDDEREDKFYGVIRVIPAGLRGVWTIGERQFTATSDTRFDDDDDDDFEVGDCAEVEYVTNDGINFATRIRTESRYKCSNGSYTNGVYGTISSFPATLVGNWVVGANTYEARSTTSFIQRNGTFSVGDCVQIRYYTQAGVNVATVIEREDAARCNRTTPPNNASRSKLYATVDAFPADVLSGPWTIGGVGFQTTSTTSYIQREGAFTVGGCVEVSYIVSDGQLLLNTVQTKDAARCQRDGIAEFRAYGAVAALPDALVGTWSVGGITYPATGATTFDQRHGFFAIGAFVEVRYRPNTDRTAVSISTHVAPHAGRNIIRGRLDQRPGDDTGEWLIDGVSYRGDAAIDINLNDEALQQGVAPTAEQAVLAVFYEEEDGTRYIVSISAPYQVYLPMVRR